jgi:hypothetical protein
VLLNVENCSEAEVAVLRTLAARGVKLAAFCGAEKVPASVAALFGVKADGAPLSGPGRPLIRDKVVTLGHGTVFVPVDVAQLFAAEARGLGPLLRRELDIPIAFPDGTTGYGFTSNGRSFLVVEDWREQGRTVSVRLRAKAGAKQLHAIDANDHRPLSTKREGADWLIQLPLRPGDAALVAFEEL